MNEFIQIQLISIAESKNDDVSSVESILDGEPVKVTCIEWSDAFRRIQSIKADDSGSPDILQVGKTWVPYFSERNKFLDLGLQRTRKPDRD
jgi:hypothetical protein